MYSLGSEGQMRGCDRARVRMQSARLSPRFANAKTEGNLNLKTRIPMSHVTCLTRLQDCACSQSRR
jgi:hypothetical protein